MNQFSNERMYESREKHDLWKRSAATTAVELRARERQETSGNGTAASTYVNHPNR